MAEKMMLQIMPKKGVGNLLFKTKRKLIQMKLGTKPIFSNSEFDDYYAISIFFNEKDQCEAIQLKNVEYDDFEYEVILEDIDLFSMTYGELKRFIRKLDIDAIISDSEIVSKKYNIAISPKEDENFENEKMEVIMVFYREEYLDAEYEIPKQNEYSKEFENKLKEYKK